MSRSLVGSSRNHEIGRLRQGSRQHQPSPLAAGQFADRRSRLLGWKQKVSHVAHDMPPLAVDRDEVAAAAGQRIHKGRRRLERGALLIERGHRHIRTETHRAGVGRKSAG